MRKLYAILLGLALVSTPVWAYDDPSYRNMVKVQSTGQVQGEAVRVIKLVRYPSVDADAASLVSGDAVRYSLLSDDGVTVHQTGTSADGAFAGIICTTIPSDDTTGTTSSFDDAGRRNWGWMVTNGYAIANSVAGGTNGHSAGDPFYTSRDGGTIAGMETVNLSFDMTTAALWRTHVTNALKAASNSGGFFYDAASGSATTYEVYVENT